MRRSIIKEPLLQQCERDLSLQIGLALILEQAACFCCEICIVLIHWHRLRHIRCGWVEAEQGIKSLFWCGGCTLCPFTRITHGTTCSCVLLVFEGTDLMKIGFWVCLIMILSWWRSFWWIFHPAFEQFRNVFGVGCISGSLVRPRTSVCVRLTIIVVTKINGWLQVLQMKIMSRWLVKGQSLTKSLLGHVDISLKPSLPLALGDWLIIWITWKTILAVTVLMAIKPCLELSELLFQVGVPVIFYIIVSSLRKVGSYGGPSAPIKKFSIIKLRFLPFFIFLNSPDWNKKED